MARLLWKRLSKRISESGSGGKSIRRQLRERSLEHVTHVRFDDPIQLHVLEHLWDYVERHVVMIEGYPCDQRRRQPLRCYGRRFYVCPQTGILLRVPDLRMPGYLPRPRHRRRNGSRR